MRSLQLGCGPRVAEIRHWADPAPASHHFEEAGQPWRALSFQTPERAEFHLRGLIRDADALRQLRAFLTVDGMDISRLGDAKVMTALATLVSRNRLVVYELGAPTSSLPRQGNQIPVATPLPALSAPLTPPPAAGARSPSTKGLSDAAPEESALEDIDQDAQAAGLRAAAVEGVPFCAICEKARRDARARPQGQGAAPAASNSPQQSLAA